MPGLSMAQVADLARENARLVQECADLVAARDEVRWLWTIATKHPTKPHAWIAGLRLGTIYYESEADAEAAARQEWNGTLVEWRLVRVRAD